MCGNGIYSTSHWKVIQPKRAFLGEILEPKLRPCSWNKNSVNENKKLYLQIAKTVSISLDIYWGKALNTKQKNLWLETIFETFIQAVLSLYFQFWELS